MSESRFSERIRKKTSEDISATEMLIKKNQNIRGELEQRKFPTTERYQCLFSHATEDMNTYFKEFTITDSFLTIGGSCEQVLNAINSGAKSIDVFDPNILCEHALALRIAAIKTLTYEQYIEYYDTFSFELFKLITYKLSYKELVFWVMIYNMLGNNYNSGEYIRSLLFTHKRLDEKLITKINPYLNKQNYNKLKEIIDSVTINYIECPIFELPEHIKEKTYDAINLSNIYHAINSGPNVDISNARNYRNFVINELLPHLNPNGTMMVSYFHNWSDKAEQDFLKLYKESNHKVVPNINISIADFKEYYLRGLTSQNLAYHQLLETFHDDGIIKIPTTPTGFGQSSDMTQDMALILRK